MQKVKGQPAGWGCMGMTWGRAEYICDMYLMYNVYVLHIVYIEFFFLNEPLKLLKQQLARPLLSPRLALVPAARFLQRYSSILPTLPPKSPGNGANPLVLFSRQSFSHNELPCEAETSAMNAQQWRELYISSFQLCVVYLICSCLPTGSIKLCMAKANWAPVLCECVRACVSVSKLL